MPRKLSWTNTYTFIALLIAGALTSACRGQDNWYDIINYHIYNPWALFNQRWSKDLFVAGIQGYFHPALDIPYYLVAMVWLPAHPVVVGLLAGLPYGVLLYVSYRIIAILVGSLNGFGKSERYFMTLCLLLLSVTGVSAWTQAGTTTNAVTVAVFVLVSVYLLLIEAQRPGFEVRGTRLLLIGFCLGLAAGFKLTSAVYAPAVGLVVMGMSAGVKNAIKNGFILTSGWIIAFAPVYGPWAWHLYATTGSPMFPMFNNIFHSRFGAAVPTRDTVSVPKNLMQWIFYPFYWQSLHTPTAYNRLMFRDGRILLFYVIAAVYFTGWSIYKLAGRREERVPRVLRIAAALCATSYVIWLLMFAMLRYAIAIEVLASIVSILLLVNYARRFDSWRRPYISGAIVAGLVSILMITTVYPDVPRIPFAKRTYVAEVPHLQSGSLVILANQPMGLLAPLIQRVNKDAVFVGLPLCFAKGQWCYDDFYHYALGKQLREKIAGHAGPMYVAYYANRMPALPQLLQFRVSYDAARCHHMSTNATANIRICSAHYVAPDVPFAQKASPMRLALKATYLAPGADVQSVWLTNRCGISESNGKLRISWRAPEGVKQVRIFLQVPADRKEILFSEGKHSGSATTGTWVKAAQTFIFRTPSGEDVARATTEYVPCGSGG